MVEEKDMQSPAVPEAGQPEVELPKEKKVKLKRNYFLVDKPFQFREVFFLMVISALMLFAGAGMGAFVAYFATAEELGFFDAMGETSFYILAELVLLLFVVVPVAGVLFTHHVAGPIFRIRREMRRVAEGERGFRVHLRKGDQMLPLADDFNQMLQSIEIKEGTLSSRATFGRETMEEVIKKIEDSDIEMSNDLKVLLQDVSESLE
jgi:methyl-accepting chemotaxis protein